MGPRWPSLPRSTIARFTVLLFVSQLALTAGALSFFRRSSEATLLAEQRELVQGLRDDLVAGFREGGERQLTELIRARLGAIETEIPVILLTRPDGSVVAGNLGAWPTVIPRSSAWTTVQLYRTGLDHPEPMGVIATALPGGDSLLTGHVIDGAVRLRDLNREATIGALLLAIPLALALALLLGRMINRRVASIAAAAEAVGAGDLSHRVVPNGSGDSFDALGQGVNAMLDRIEALIGELRIVTDGLAHDLRSPITRLKSTLERAILDTQDGPARTALQRVAGEADALHAMLATALQISRAEAGIGRERFERVDLAALLADLAELYGPVAEEGGMTLTSRAPPGLVVAVHREVLSQALGNLIENALKYATGGRAIVLEATSSGRGYRLAVVDDGPGIPVERHAEALKKFGRLDPSRSAVGSGLGLALAEAVAKLHGGGIALEDNRPGLRVVLTLDP